MSYLVLARKWRPRTFADVVGQQHVLQALTHSLEHERLHHAYLFAGTRGVGKTTLARILAKALNCEGGVAAEPCGECSACHEIDEGRFVDLIEVDAASRTKVDDTRELLDNVQYAPTRGRYKVYLIDEVHMLSTHSFNALLKTLEEPPPHVKFLLATTDPQKLPVTVLSRCLQFNLKRLTPALIRERLAWIAEQECIDAEPAALQLMARAADGSLRDALSLMDQAVAFGGGQLAEAAVAEMLGALDRGQVFALIEQLARDDADAVLQIIADADALFPDYKRLLSELAQMLTRIAVLQATGGASDVEADEMPALESLAEHVKPEDAQLWYQFAINGKRDLPYAPDPRSAVEMTLLRMLAFRPPIDGAAVTAGSDSPAARSRNPAPGASVAPERVPQTTAAQATAAADPGARPDASQTEPAGTSAPDDWHRLVGQLRISGVVRLLAANCAFQDRDGQCIRLTLDKRSESMLTEPRTQELQQALSEHLGEAVSVDIMIAGEAGDTPLRRAVARERQAQREQRESLEADAGIVEMKKLFDAEIADDRPAGGTGRTA